MRCNGYRARRATASEQDTPRMSMTDSTQIGESWIKEQIRTSLKTAQDAVLGAVGGVIVDERLAREKAVNELRRENETLRDELTALKTEVAELRGNSGFNARLMALRAAWPNWKRHWHGSRLRADGRIRGELREHRAG
jgi:hypothetical protein